MNRFFDGEIGNRKLSPIGAYYEHRLLPLEEALEPVKSYFSDLNRSIRDAKKYCCYPSTHGLTKDESAAIYLYTMEGAEKSFYRIINEVLRTENRRKVVPWFGYLKLFDTALSKLPIARQNLWRGLDGNLSGQFKKGDTLTWWSISSCSAELEVVKDFMGSNKNATLLMIEAKTARDVTGYTSYPDEKVLILRPGIELQVKGDISPHGALRIVHLTELCDEATPEPPTPPKPIPPKTPYPGR